MGAGLLWNLRLAGSGGPARGFLQLPRGRRNWLTYLLKSRKNECRNAPCKALGVLKRDPVPVQGSLTAYIYIYQKKKEKKSHKQLPTHFQACW